jgi:hypothetical protein
VIRPGDHHRLRDTGVPEQRRLDLAQLHPESPDLDLVVEPAEELEVAACQPAHPVPGPVHPGAGGTERIRDEPRRGQAAVAEVAAGHAGARQVQLTRHAGRHPA